LPKKRVKSKQDPNHPGYEGARLLKDEVMPTEQMPNFRDKQPPGKPAKKGRKNHGKSSSDSP
jgi:hypothetical protein